jgi:cobalt-zinc-cadmium efflux system protein
MRSHDQGTGLHTRTIYRLYISLGIATGITVLEFVGGVLARSLALLGDSGHVATDALSLGIAVLATRFAARPHTPTFTYGYHRIEVLAALINGATLVSVSGYVFYEAYGRLASPAQVQGSTMAAVALAGLLANLVMVSLLKEGRRVSINVKGVFLHVVGDALSSASALLAGIVIVVANFSFADSVASLFIGALMLRNTYGILHETVVILLERSPPEIDSNEVVGELLKIAGVRTVHELHIWRLTSGFDVLSVHLIVEAHAQDHEVLKEANRMLLEKFKIRHTTIQIGHSDESPLAVKPR